MPGRTTIRSAWTMLLVGLVLSALAGVATAATDWLATCSKCISPLVFSKTGIGTSNAVAEARVTQAAVAEWCGSWQPDNKLCVKQQMAAEDLKTVYRASANCSAGSITPVDGQTYRMAGVWEKGEIGAGRSKWRDSTGMIVPRDNASGGLGISQQWELLCPAGSKNAKATPAAA